MSTQFTNRQWRLPNNENKDKQSNYSMNCIPNAAINISSPVEVGITSSFSFWLKRTNNTAISQPYRVVGNGLYGMYISSSAMYVRYGGAAITINNTETLNAIALTDWVHWVITREEVTSTTQDVRLYANGSLVYSLNGTLGLGTLDSKVDVLMWSLQTTDFMDGFAIFDYALSSSQVTTLYGSSSTGIGNPMSLSPKPVAYYPLGDQDAFNGADYLVPNSSLKDYVFDFANSNIEVDSIGDLFSGITNFSFSGWFNLTSFVSQQVFNILEGSNWKFGINTYNYQLRFNVNPGVAYIASLQNITSTNTWFHYAGVFDGSGASDTDRLKLYINGQPQTVTYSITTPTSFPTLLSTADISIGGSLAPFNGMTGKASNIQLWDTNLSSTEIETLYNNGSPYTGTQPQNSNLQGWWKLNASATYDSSTTTWTIPDDSTNSNDGTSSGMTQANLVQSDLSFTSGYSPYALDFDAASSDLIQINNGSSLTNGFSELTVSIWANFSSNLSQQQIISKDDTSQRSWILRKLSSGVNFLVSTDGTSASQTLFYPSSSITIGKWYHFVGIYDGSKLLLYVDGVLIDDSVSLTGSLPSTTSGLFIGSYGFNNNTTFDGSLSNASIWNTALTSAQVTEIYNEGVPSNLNNHSAYSNLVSWWQLGSNSSFNTNWTVLDEKGSNNGTSTNMGEDAIVDGVGSYANGLSSGMGGDEVIGDAPFSDANSLSVNMDVLDRVEDTPS
jgi:hypothetical protein